MPKWQKQHTATSNLQKVDFKGQVLNTKWPDEFFVQHSNEALCLLWNNTNTTFSWIESQGAFHTKHVHRQKPAP